MEANISGEFPCSSIAVDSVLRTGTAGLIWGCLTSPHDATRQGIYGTARVPFIARSIGRYGFQWGLFAAAFSFTCCGIQRFRRKADLVNVVTASAVAGTVVGGTRQWKQVAGITAIVSLLYRTNDDSRSV